MPENTSEFIIEKVDVMHALRKWDGRDYEFVPGEKNRREWKANDCEFYNALSNGRIDARLLRRFSVSNSDKTESRRTGGYSITRKFWGGIETRTPVIQSFYEDEVLPAKSLYSKDRDSQIARNLVIKLASIEAVSPKGNARTLGIVSASKLCFFTCPEMPITTLLP